jgi:RNA polymerase sigma factor (TIGR02999 family)
MSDIRDLSGDDASIADLFEEIMGELRLLSTLYMKTHPPEVTLQPTVIVSEAFVRLAGHKPEQFKDEDDFRATASVILRQVFAERAKKRIEEKRRAEKAMDARRAIRAEQAAASEPEVELPSFEGASPELAMALENALESLSEVDDRAARVAELRIFGSLPIPTVSSIVGVSEAGAEKDWRFAKAFLQKQLKSRGHA